MILESILTCPNCSHQKQEKLLENTFPTKFRCENCKEMGEVKLELAVSIVLLLISLVYNHKLKVLHVALD